MKNNSQPKGLRGRDFRYGTGRDLGLVAYMIPKAPKGIKPIKVVEPAFRGQNQHDDELALFEGVAL